MGNAEEPGPSHGGGGTSEPQFFAVIPLADCPHLREVKSAPDEINVRTPCGECSVIGENWLCLSCFQVHCGRHLASHAVFHFEESRHPMALGFADLTVWCYECDSYVHNEVLSAVKNAAYRNKFPNE